jgi:hypothetical protein
MIDVSAGLMDVDHQSRLTSLTHMPLCAEKIILTLLVHIDLRIKLTAQNTPSLFGGEEVFNEELQKVKNYCDNDLGAISAALKRKDWKSIKELLETLLRQIRPFDIHELQLLVEKAREAAKSIEGQEILLLLGRTGSGKSTTIHFVSGSKMEKQSLDGLAHIAPVEIKNEILQEVTTSPHAKSETRYIRAIPINFKDVGLDRDGGIVICDTPGFEDTNGPEVDVANGLGVVEAVRKSKSVRPVVLISNKSVGDRGELIKSLAHLLVGIVANIKDHLDSFSYLFTKYSDKELSQIHASLKSVKNHLTVEEKSDAAFVSLFESMLEATEDGALGIDPLNDEPKKLLRTLTKIKAIQHPEEVFQFSTTEKSKSALKDQVFKHQFSIQRATTEGDYNLVLYKLDELKILINLLNQDFIKQTYQESIKYVVKHLEKQYTLAIDLLDKGCLDGNHLSGGEVNQYLAIVDELNRTKQLRSQHLGHEAMQSAGLIQHVILKASELVKDLAQHDVRDRILRPRLDKLKLLAKFSEEVKGIYQRQCDLLNEQSVALTKSIRNSLSIDDFSKIAHDFTTLHKMGKELYDHLSEATTKQHYADLQKELLAHFQTISANALKCLGKDKKLEKSDFGLITKSLSQLEEIKGMQSLIAHIPQNEELLKCHAELIQELLSYFEKVRKNIEVLFEKKREASFEEIQVLMQELEALHAIESINSKTSESYFKTIEALCGFVKELKRDVEQELKLFLKTTETVDCQKLSKGIVTLKKTAWLDKYKEDFSEEVLQEIREEMVVHVAKEKQRLLLLPLKIEDYGNVADIYKGVQRLQAMQPLEQGLPELKTIREELIEGVEKQLSNNFRLIRTLFNPDGEGLRDLELIQREYEKIISVGAEKAQIEAKKILSDAEYADISSLKREFDKLSQEFDRFSDVTKKSSNILNATAKRVADVKKIDEEYESKIATKTYKAREAGKEYLDKRGYQSVEELEKELFNAKEEFRLAKEESDRNEEQSQKLLIKINGLSALESQYESMLKTCEEKSKNNGLTFLVDRGYANFMLLNDAIRLKKERIEKLADRSVSPRQQTEELDTGKAEIVFCYFDACRDIHLVREDLELTKQLFNGIIKNYVTRITEKLSTLFNKIKQTDETTTPQSISEVAQALLVEFRHLNELKESAPNLFSWFPSKIMEQYKQSLEEFLNELSEEMIKLQRSPRALKTKLMLAKSLSRFDYLIDGEKYLSLYIRYRDVFYAETKVTATILTAIKDGDYVTIASELGRFSQLDDPATINAVAQIKDTLTRSLNDFIDDSKTKVIMLGSSIDQEAVKSIKLVVVNLNKIKEVQTLLTQYLDPTVNSALAECIEFVKSSISSQITRFLDSVEAAVDSNNFYESDLRMELISQIRILLGSYCTPDIVQKRDALRVRIESELDSVVKKYTDIPIKDYPVYPPKEIFEKFQLVRDRDQKYTRALTKIKEGILEKCRTELDFARKYDAVPPEKNPHIRSVNTALKFLPEELSRSLGIELETAKEDIQTKVDQINESVEQLIAVQNISEMQVYIEKHKDRNEAVLPMKNLRESILKNIRDCKSRIDERLDQDDIAGILPDLKQLCDYKEKLGELVPLVSNYFFQVKTGFNKTLIQLMKNINDGISDSDDVGNYSGTEVVTVMERNITNLTPLIEFRTELLANHASDEPVSFDIFPDDFSEKLEFMNKKLLVYFKDLFMAHSEGLKEMNFESLQKSLNGAKKWDGFLRKLKRYINVAGAKNESITELDGVISKIKYNDMLDAVKNNLIKSSESIKKLELLSEKAIIGTKAREDLYTRLNSDLIVLLQSRNLMQHFDIKSFDIEKMIKECYLNIQHKVEFIAKESNRIISKATLSANDYEGFNRYYNCLTTLAKCVPSLESMSIRIPEELRKLDDKIKEKVNLLAANLPVATTLEDVAKIIIDIKRISDGIVAFKTKIDTRIDQLLNEFKRQKGAQELAKLGSILNSEPSGIGQIILAEHKCFVGYAVHLFNQKTQRHGIDYVIANIDGSDIDKNKLRSRYQEFSQKYQGLIVKYLKKPIDFDSAISGLKMSLVKVKSTGNDIRWSASVRDSIPELLAHVLALWTLKNADHYFDAEGMDDKNSYLLQPHAAQVISIFRMLGIDDSNPSLKNNLVQIGTGEGKSVTLAATAATLALLGFDVSCACYSDYLSGRDYNEFLWLFDLLDVSDRIHYGTFNKLCESVINEKGNIRDIVRNMVSNEKPASSLDAKSLISHPKILLVDEVDVFFSKDFYGNVYTPSASLMDPTITSLTDFIWAQKDVINFAKVIRSAEYKACCARYKGWEFLIEEAVKDMLSDLKTFISHDYIVINDKIGYKEQDRIVFNMVIGYKTLFAYYYQHQQGKISEKSLRENISISINCGNFSYAEVPHSFKNIMGVTGTLRTLSEPEKNIVRNVYGIQKNTYSPSVFGVNNLIFREDADIKIENGSDFLNVIKVEIDHRLIGQTPSAKRAVLVFFESKEKLMGFYNSPGVAAVKDSFSIMTEEVDNDEKLSLIKKATNSGRITLLTKSFGRGTDFVSRDQVVSANGGAHVIQTFLSTEISEETQIKGRTARQGDHGSYSMVLLDKSLEPFLITTQDIADMKSKGKFYSLLNDKRNKYFEQQYNEDTKFVEQAKKEHESAMRFVDSLHNNDLGFISKFLGQYNKGATITNRSRTIVLMDATGSMSHLLQKAKNTVGTMFERAGVVLKENGIPEDSFEMQFAVYRNYDCKIDSLLQVSSWETKPDNLRKFMDTISASGGTWMEEAVEIGLWHVNEEAKNGEVSQVILIGDAPANSQAQVTKGRSMYQGDAYWRITKFNVPTYYQTEVNKLAGEKIPVHCFYVHNSAMTMFKQVSAQTGGRSEFLDVNSSQGAEALTNLVTEEVLRSVGGVGQGTQLVEAYRTKFARSFKG